MSKKRRIVTHNGQFHADEVLACGILQSLYEGNIEIIRSRDQKVIDSGDIVVDVGKVYDPKNNRFDHHQLECNEKYSNEFDINMSSVGMVYKSYAHIYFQLMYGKLIKENNVDMQCIIDTVYRSFIMEIDAIDNGVKQTNSQLNYFVNTNLSTTISKFNTDNIYSKEQDDAFHDAMSYSMQTFNVHVKSIVNRFVNMTKDYDTITNSMKTRFQYCDTGEILVIPVNCPNWLYCIREYENKNPYYGSKNVKYVIYPDNDTEWRIKAMPTFEQFVSRKNLKSVEDIVKINSDISDKIVFVHSAKFVGGAKSLEAAVEMGKISLLDEKTTK